MTTSTSIDSLSGDQLRDMFAAATAWLEANAPAINAVNVFPVPDGDTGTNMYLTMRSVMEEANRAPSENAGATMAAMSRGALMGARGNSGVILSQIMRGISRAFGESEAIDAATWARALDEGSQGAYRAVTKPTEGTILTVSREAAAAALASLKNGAGDIVSLMETTLRAAEESLERTPTLLPVLAEAGVVDAGGKGYVTLLDGMTRHLKGEPMDVAPAEEGEVGQEWLAVTSQLHEHEESLYGYCTEILISGKQMDPDAFRERILALGDSVLVVGDEKLIRVHVHTDDPGAVLSGGTSIGSLIQVKVDNIHEQAERFLEMHERHGEEAEAGANVEAGPISTVAVAAGEGLAKVFRSVGCTRVVSGGPTMNPSTKDIVDAVEACPTDEVIVLPNDKNIVMAAKQAEGLTGKRLAVVETRSVPQGIASLLALNQEDDLDANVAAMDEARQAVCTVEVCEAVRTTTIGGVEVREGEIIAIIDDELKLSAETPGEALLRALEGVAEGASLVTLYYGAGTAAADAEALSERVRERYPALEVEVVEGGQPHYHYIASVE